jgi:PAS domain S-box-containing protein
MKAPNESATNNISSQDVNNYDQNQPIENHVHEIALEISNVGLWDWDVLNDKVFYSKESKRLIGYDDNEFGDTSKFWDDKVHPDDKENYYRDFNLHLNGSIDVYESEYRIRCKNGSYKWVLDKGKVVELTNDKKPKRIIGTHTDITRIKKHETQLSNNLRLITSQNKRLHNFTHIVSHNLKTHIGNLKNILEFYNEATNASEKEDLIVHLKSISDSLTHTIIDLDDIINIKSKASLKQLNEHINLNHCIDQVIESLKIDSFNKDVIIHNTVEKDETLFTNRSYLESVFFNLISNGIKYSDPNKNSQIIIQSIQTPEYLKIIISDNGIGIDLKKYQHKIFEMYQTFHGTKREDSRGVGLYITKTQVEALNGEIEIKSTLGEGTAFTLTFKKQKAL